MRRSRIFIFVSAIVFMVVVVCVVIALQQPANEVKLPDGSILRLEQVAFGKRENVTVTAGSMWKRMKDNMASKMPKALASLIFPGGVTNRSNWRSSFSTAHTNLSTLNVWLTRHNASTGRFLSVDVRNAEIVDEDGCVFGATTSGGEDNGVLPAPASVVKPASSGTTLSGSFFGGTATPMPGIASTAMRSSVTWFCFEVFPRRDKRFKVRFYDDQRKLLAEFEVPNPGPFPPVIPAAPLIPVSSTNGPVTFTLNAAGMRTNTPTRILIGNMNAANLPVTDTMLSNYREAWFKFEARDAAGLADDWEPVTMELSDGSGNLAPVRSGLPVPLCPREPVWRLSVNFAARAGSKLASNSIWTITNVVIPPAATAKPLEGSFDLQELSFRLVAVAGPGSFKYQNGAVVEATALPAGSGRGTISSSSSPAAQTIRASMPSVALVIQGNIATNHWLSVAVRDDKGRETFARTSAGVSMFTAVASPRGPYPNRQPQYLGRSARGVRGMAVSSPVTVFMLDLDRDAVSVDITFCLHTPVTAEFEFKPGGAPAKPDSF